MNKELNAKYYNDNATAFIESTFNCDMSKQYEMLENYLNYGDSILDVGFGSARDSLYFSKNYNVSSIDVIDSFIEHAKKIGLKNVRKLSVLELNDINLYDGIFCCASLLHLSIKELKIAFNNLYNALKKDGYIYVSFKYGDFEGIRNGRYFTDMTLDKLDKLVNDKFIIKNNFISLDVRKEKDDKWLNVILQKM